MTMDITIPTNTTATIYVPGKNVTEGGTTADNAEGVHFYKYENGYNIYMVEPGKYNFNSSMNNN